jgi:signal transduction histidine kinase
VVLGDEALLGRLVANLLENAVRHNRPGGGAWLTVGADARYATIRVANDGPHVPRDALGELTEPFRRLDRHGASGGYGLGLSIVRAVAEAHGGKLELRSRDDGGLEAEVRLPAHPGPAPASLRDPARLTAT